MVGKFKVRPIASHEPDWNHATSKNDIHTKLALEAKTDCYGKDLLFVTSFAFCVITFEPIMI